MKNIRRLAVLIISLALLLCFAVPASAAANGSITIHNAIVGQTYTIYRIFDLESYDEATGAFSYKVAAKWAPFFNAANNTGALNYVRVDAAGYVTWNPEYTDPETYVSFARRANDYAKSEGIANDGRKKAASTEVCFEGLPLGYYLTDTTTGALCALNTTKPAAVAEEKNITPTVQKLTREGGQYKSSNDANMGDSVDFQTTIIAQKGAEKYVLHDKMDAGLQWNQGVTVTLNDNMLDSSKYTLRTCSAEPTVCEGCTFEVVFTDVFCNSLKANDRIVISYSACLLPTAVVGAAGNKNTTWLSYGDSNNTVKSTSVTYTWGTAVFKYFNRQAEGNTVETPLANAKFRMLKNGTPINLVKDTTDANLYRVCTKGNCGSAHTHVTEITTDSTGKFRIQGLDSGTYQLEETAAPAGYNKLSAPIPVIISPAGKVNATEELPDGVSQIKVLNKTGSILPQTGGPGVTGFYVAGGASLLIAAGLVVAAVRKKHSDPENG